MLSVSDEVCSCNLAISRACASIKLKHCGSNLLYLPINQASAQQQQPAGLTGPHFGYGMLKKLGFGLALCNRHRPSFSPCQDLQHKRQPARVAACAGDCDCLVYTVAACSKPLDSTQITFALSL